MREIKFRVWNTETNKMIINVKEMGVFALQSIYSIDEFLVIPTDEKYPLMQYTGLKDKNGKEIHEGDIVKTNLYNINGYVYYSAPSFGIKQKNGICTDYNWSDFNNFEIIGNIYENPELLEE